MIVVRSARQARNEKSTKLFQFFRQGASEVLIASMARWEEQLKGLVVLERHCLALREEVEHLGERQTVLAVVMEGKMNMQKTAPQYFQRQIFKKGEGKDSAKVGIVKGNRTMVRSPGQILPLVRARPPWLLTQTKQCRPPFRWQQMQTRRCLNRLGLLWHKERKGAGGALTWRVKFQDRRRIPNGSWATGQLGQSSKRGKSKAGRS